MTAFLDWGSGRSRRRDELRLAVDGGGCWAGHLLNAIVRRSRGIHKCD